MTNDINEVLSFWFGTETNQKQLIRKQSKLWWGKDTKVDLDINERFGEIYQLAINDKLDDWLNSIKGQLALIIVLDQFSRVINRDSAAAFTQDSKALAIALEGVGKNYDNSLQYIERFFISMDGVSEILFQTPTVGALCDFYVPASMQAMSREDTIIGHNR